MEHRLNCKNGGLVDLHHNEVADEWATLCGIALNPTCISYDPTIFSSGEAESMGNQSKPPLPSSDIKSSKKNKNKSNKAYAEAKGDKGVIGSWKRGCMCVFDIKITDTVNKSYRGQDSQKNIQQNEKAKKDKNLKDSLDRCQHFSPLVYSVDGFAGKETRASERKLVSFLASKLHRE